MCGIIGYIGDKEAQPILIDGLKRLEYRGYDSAGIATLGHSGLAIRKRGGRIARLEELLETAPAQGTLGIGHTRWATHGAPTDDNAHPQTDEKKQIAVVHNGVLENDASLRARLERDGAVFQSQTDTELIAVLLSRLYKGNMTEALVQLMPQLQGSYALCILCVNEPDRIFCVRNGSPLIVGANEEAAFAASDVPALLPYLKNVCALRDGQIACLSRGAVQAFDRFGEPAQLDDFPVQWRAEDAETGGYPHYMLKEIMEQPAAAARTKSAFSTSASPALVPSRVTLVGCGTAYHAAQLGAHYLRNIAHIDASACPSSEYEPPVIPILRDELLIAVSQSGETADTLSVVTEMRGKMRTLCLTNTRDSSISRICDETLLTQAGPEIAVASTKAYATQALSLLLYAKRLAGERELGDDPLPGLLQRALALSGPLQRFADETLSRRYFLFIGRGADYITACEAALKAKEVSYLPCESYPAGELKHGPIALIEEGVPVIALCTQARASMRTLLTLREASARGAFTVCFCPRAFVSEAKKCAQRVFPLPDAPEELLPILSVIPMQLLAYHMAVSRGLDVDKPRNLAKSVTVS